MQIDLGDRTSIKGRMLVNKYSAFSGQLYAEAGAPVYLVSYMGIVTIVELEQTGNRFPALATEIFFGTGEIVPDESRPVKNTLPAKKRKASNRKQTDQTPALF